MSGFVLVLIGVAVFVLVAVVLAVLIWALAPSSSDDESRLIADMLRTHYELDLLARDARERIARARAQSH